MPRIRVLVVDDSVVFRRLISDTLSRDDLLEVAGVAPHGRIALQKIPQLSPDVVTLDVEMPEMDGIQTLREIRKLYPDLPVIMFSTATGDGSPTTLEATAAGASGCVLKPSNTGSINDAIKQLQESLIPKIRSLCRRTLREAGGEPSRQAPPTPRKAAGTSPDEQPAPSDIVCVGASTGGPNALAEVLGHFPKQLPVPVVLVQHMPPLFTERLAERLSACGGIPFAEGQDGEDVLPGRAYVAPGGKHMEVVRTALATRIQIHEGPPEHSCRPSVDVLFRSVANAYRSRTLAVVLTGMGQDGSRGCEWIREQGGQVIVQDEATSVIWGMPGTIANAGLANLVLPLTKIRGEILRRIARPQPTPAPARNVL